MPPIVLDGTTGITTPGLTNTGTETLVNLTTTGNTILGDASTDTLNVGNGGLVKDASGNVGIGTASPTTFIQVLGGAASGVNVINWNARLSTGAAGSSAFGAVGTGIYLDSFTNNGAGTQPVAGVSSFLVGGGTGGAATNHSGGLAFWTKSSASASLTRVVSIDNDGNFGVGVNLPGLPFDVSKTGAQVGSTTAYTIGRFREGVPNKGVTLGYDSGSQTGIVLSETTGASSNLAFWTYEAGLSGWAERARIDSAGNLLVGATSADARIFAYSSTGTSFKALNPSNVAQLLIGYNNTSYNYMDADNNIFRSGNGTERARINSSGLTLTGSIFPSAFATYTISTNTWVANTFYQVIAPGSLANYTTYWITARWDHGGGGGPFIMATAFMFSVVNTNGTGTDNIFTPLTSTHTGSGATLSFRSRAGSGASTGLEASASSIVGGTLTVNIYRFV